MSLSNVRVVHPADYLEQPWRNGAGTSQEICRYPESAARWRWRLSKASIDQDGPMSTFAGYQRWMALLEGKGLRLALDGLASLRFAQAGDEDAFPGRLGCNATLDDGPVQVLNLIAADGITHRAKRVQGNETFVLASAMDVAIHASGAECLVSCGDESWTVPNGSSWLAGLEDLVFLEVSCPAPGMALVLTIDRSAVPSARASTEAPAARSDGSSSPEPLPQASLPDLEAEEEAVDPDQFPRRARVRETWIASNAPPRALAEGDVVIVGNSDPRWPDWTRFTTARGHNGWVPRAWLSIDGMRGRLDRTHDARELAVAAEDEVELLSRELGWYRARKLDGSEGWLPPCCIDG